MGKRQATVTPAKALTAKEIFEKELKAVEGYFVLTDVEIEWVRGTQVRIQGGKFASIINDVELYVGQLVSGVMSVTVNGSIVNRSIIVQDIDGAALDITDKDTENESASDTARALPRPV